MATFVVSYLPHQSGFIKRLLFSNIMYDEKLRIVGDWKFYMQQIVKYDRTLKLIDLIISKREQGGISNSDSNLNSKERIMVLNTR